MHMKHINIYVYCWFKGPYRSHPPTRRYLCVMLQEKQIPNQPKTLCSYADFEFAATVARTHINCLIPT